MCVKGFVYKWRARCLRGVCVYREWWLLVFKHTHILDDVNLARHATVLLDYCASIRIN